jgi:hypothetical protein
MGKWVHRIEAYDPITNLVMCAACGWTEGERSDHNRFGMRCATPRRSRGRSTRGMNGYYRRMKNLKKDFCENAGCTATIVDPCQLEMDHKDGDYSNNDPSNIQTLCCNCHRLKTALERRKKH